MDMARRAGGNPFRITSPLRGLKPYNPGASNITYNFRITSPLRGLKQDNKSEVFKFLDL